MESVDLDMGDLFDEEAMDDDDVGTVSALPDLPEYREGGDGDGEGGEPGENEDAENTEVLAKLKDLSKGAAKKRVSRPQPKLDAARLTGERGIPILPKVFERVKFKGRGHEAQDLALLMRNLEHWAHRLFPKMPFDEVLERAERLGAKREVQTCVKKMRLDMPILNDEFVGSDKEDDDVIRQGDYVLPQARTAEEMEDEWDELIREAEESQASQTPPRPSHSAPGPSHATPGPSQVTCGPSQDTPGLRYDTPGPAGFTEESQSSTPAQQRTSTDSPFTPEQLERMEKNKQLAREKRLAKLGIRSPATPVLSRPAPGGSQSTQRGPDFQTPTSQTSQNEQNERVTSPQNQTDSRANVNSEGENSNDQSTKNSEDILGDTCEQSQKDSEDNEMSEVIRTQNERVVVGQLQDAQDWCTELSISQTGIALEDTESTVNDSLETDLIPTNETNTEKKSQETDSVRDKRDNAIDSSLKSAENGVKESENGVINGPDSQTDALLDSEEMSEVIPYQNAGKIPLMQKPHTQNAESVEEMSEIIERQDYQRPSSEHNNKENMVCLVNGVAEINETGDLKSKDLAVIGKKGQVLNGLDSNTGLNEESKVTVSGTDELNEEELMDTLES